MKVQVGVWATLLISTLFEPVSASRPGRPGRPGPKPGRSGSFTQSYCYTTLGSTSIASVPTKSRTFTATYTLTHIYPVQPMATITPSTKTITTTSTSVVTRTATTQNTDTQFAASTKTITQTTTADTSTITSTSITSSVTTIFGTTTVSPRFDNFLPVQSTLPGAATKKRRSTANNTHLRGLQSVKRSHQENNSSRIAVKEMIKKNRYPHNVMCNVFVDIPVTITTAKTKSTTKTATAETPLTTDTETTLVSTTTTTTLGDASTTITTTTQETMTETSTPITTTTTVSTSVSTINAPQATVYAQCAPNNIATYINGQRVNEWSASSVNPTFTTASSPYDCCVQCFMNSDCETAQYLDDGLCLLSPVDSCNTAGQYSERAFHADFDADPVYVSNGNCGAYTQNF